MTVIDRKGAADNGLWSPADASGIGPEPELTGERRYFSRPGVTRYRQARTL